LPGGAKRTASRRLEVATPPGLAALGTSPVAGSSIIREKWRGPESNRRHHDFQSCSGLQTAGKRDARRTRVSLQSGPFGLDSCLAIDRACARACARRVSAPSIATASSQRVERQTLSHRDRLRAHNPKVPGSNPAPLSENGPGTGSAFRGGCSRRPLGRRSDNGPISGRTCVRRWFRAAPRVPTPPSRMSSSCCGPGGRGFESRRLPSTSKPASRVGFCCTRRRSRNLRRSFEIG
jgi:hypothetical protein